MANENRSVGTQLQLLNAKLTWSQKISIVVFGAAVIAGMSAMIYFMNQEEYQTLYSGLSMEESGTVIAKLKELKVPYTLDDSGKMIKVPAAQVDELRIQLASEGLPQTGKIGFEVFDRTNLGMTEFLEKVNYKRALEGELVRTILSLKEIAQARVHLVLPKESLFEQASEPAKASVVIKLNSGRQLPESVVLGMVHLVSSAVEGLDPKNVTIVDSNGSLLSARQASSEVELSGTQLELKARTEKDLSTKVQRILEPVVGEGKVKADTSVVMDFTRSEQTEEKYDPQATAIRSRQTSQEQNQPATVANAGVPGTASNDVNPAPTFTPTGKTGSSFMKDNETTNYEVSHLTRHTVEPAGDIKKVSVAVIVDDSVKIEKAQDGSTSKKTAPRTPEELKKIRDLVSAAIGIDAERGDTLTVENIAFDVPADAEPGDTLAPTFLERWKDVIQPALKYGAFLLLFLMVYLFLIRPVSRRLLSPIDQVQAIGSGRDLRAEAAANLGLATPKTVRELEAEVNSGSMALASQTDVRKADILRQRIAELVQRDPQSSAQLLRAWLTQQGK